MVNAVGLLIQNGIWNLLTCLENDPVKLSELTIAEYAERGGMEGAEVLSYLIMRGALSDKIKKIHQAYCVPSMTAIGTLIFENQADEPDPAEQEAQRKHIGHQLDGIEKLDGTYPFTLEVSHKTYRINDFLHRLIIPEHRERFVNDTENLFQEYQLSDEEIRNAQCPRLARTNTLWRNILFAGKNGSSSWPGKYRCLCRNAWAKRGRISEDAKCKTCLFGCRW